MYYWNMTEQETQEEMQEAQAEADSALPQLCECGDLAQDCEDDHGPAPTDRELKDAKGQTVGWIRQLSSGTYKRMVGGEWYQICPHCGSSNNGPHVTCAVEVYTIVAPEGAVLDDHTWFHHRALDMGYNLAVMPTE